MRNPGLIDNIDHLVQIYDWECVPFAWTVTAEAIFGKLDQSCNLVPETKQ